MVMSYPPNVTPLPILMRIGSVENAQNCKLISIIYSTTFLKCSYECCRYKITDIRGVVEKYEKIAGSLQTIKDKENFLQDCKYIFHPNHFVPFLVKFSLCMVSC